MQQKTLIGSVRTALKKAKTRKLRRMGKIPAVVYGHTAPQQIYIDENEFNKKFHVISENIIIKLTTDGTSRDVLVKDFQEDPISKRILHIDFYEIEKGKILRTHVPIHFEGTPEGVKLGGIIEVLLHELEVECLPKDLPETISHDITELTVGDSIHVSELRTPEGIRILNSPDQVVFFSHPCESGN